MAIENFDEKNIQDTFQRVVQTDGTNQLADGTGSIFTPISSSHAITSSHALFAISASHEVTFELSSSHAETSTTASFATNFTASGNISASGNVITSKTGLPGFQYIDYNTDGININVDDSAAIKIEKDTGAVIVTQQTDAPFPQQQTFTVVGNMSASLDLSVERTTYTKNLQVNETGSFGQINATGTASFGLINGGTF